MMRQFDTTERFILSRSNNPSVDEVVSVLGFDTKGDGGENSWVFKGVTGQTPSQSPNDLSAPYLNDASGNQWELVNFVSFNSQNIGLNRFTIYVSTTGDDSNAGWLPGQSLLTLQGAFDKIKSLGAQLSGAWEINVAAGFYVSNGAFLSNVYFEERLKISGPDVGGHPNVPTAIFDGSLTSSTNGIDLSRIFAEIEDIKVQNFFTNVIGRDGSDVFALNLHCSGADENGYHFRRGTITRVEGGIFELNRQGSRFDSNCYYQLGSSGNKPIYRNNTNFGIRPQESAQGIASIETDGNVLADVFCNDVSRIRLFDCDFNDTDVAVVVQGQSRVQDSGGNTYNGVNKRIEFRAFTSEGSLHASGSSSEARMLLDKTDDTLTGTTALTIIKNLWTIPADLFSDEDRTIRVEAWGETSGSGTKTVQIRANNASLFTPSNASIGSGGQNWKLDLKVWSEGTSQQKYAGTLKSDNNEVYIIGTRTINSTIDLTLEIQGELTDAAGSITVNAAEVRLEG